MRACMPTCGVSDLNNYNNNKKLYSNYEQSELL